MPSCHAAALAPLAWTGTGPGCAGSWKAMLVTTKYSATSMTRPRCPWPPPPRVEGMAHALAYSSLVKCFSVVLLGVPMMGVSLGCRNMSMDGDNVMFAVWWAGTVIWRHGC